MNLILWLCYFMTVFLFGMYIGYEFKKAKIAELERLLGLKDDELKMEKARFARERFVDSLSDADLVGRVINSGDVDKKQSD